MVYPSVKTRSSYIVHLQSYDTFDEMLTMIDYLH